MKQKLCVLMALVLLLSLAVLPRTEPAQAVEADPYLVEGGRAVYDFSSPDQQENWQFFTEFDKTPWIQDGKLFAWTLAEQKMILLRNRFTDVDVSVDISTINEGGKFDAGIYVGAFGVSGQIDGINAWQVNIEHSAGNSSYYLKLHRFENAWKGVKLEVSGIPYTGDTIHLRVVVKEGVLYAFLNHQKEPTLTYNIGVTTGHVGLRCFYSPNVFDNFTVIGEGIPVEEGRMDSLTAQAQALLEENLAEESLQALREAVSLAESATTQTEVDGAVKALEAAVERAVPARSFAELTALIAETQTLANPDGMVYTENSWNSLMAVKDICKGLHEASSEWDISYWYGRLKTRMDDLIPYIREVAA